MDTSPSAPHLDDEALSGALDADLGAVPGEAAAAHLATCAQCARRRDDLAAARAALASAPVELLDELARRRLVARALAEAPMAGERATRPWYLRPAVAGGVAAALLAILAAVPFLSGGGDADREEGAVQALRDTPFLGDLGDLSDPALVRASLQGLFPAEANEAGTPSVGGALDEAAPPPAEGAPPRAAVPAPGPGAPEPETDLYSSPGSVRATAEAQETQPQKLRAGRDSAVLDRAVTDECAAILADGPARDARLVATAVGTYRGIPAVVAAFATGSGTTAYVAARDDCRVLDRYPV